MLRMDHQIPPDSLPVYHLGGTRATSADAPDATHSALPRRDLSARTSRRLSMHAACVLAYRAHTDSTAGDCALCRQAWPCRTRRATAQVIEAHADDPSRYDGRLQLVAGVAASRAVVLAG